MVAVGANDVEEVWGAGARFEDWKVSHTFRIFWTGSIVLAHCASPFSISEILV